MLRVPTHFLGAFLLGVWAAAGSSADTSSALQQSVQLGALCQDMAQSTPNKWPDMAYKAGFTIATRPKMETLHANEILVQAAHQGQAVPKDQLAKFLSVDMKKYISLSSVLKREPGKRLAFANAKGAVLTIKDRLGQTKGLTGLTAKCTFFVPAHLGKRKAKALTAQLAGMDADAASEVQAQAGVFHVFQASNGDPNAPAAQQPVRVRLTSIKGKGKYPPLLKITIDHRNIQ